MPHFEFEAIYSVQGAKIHVSIWEMKGGTYTMTLAKIQVRGIFRMRDIRRNVLPKLWRRHAGAHLDKHQHGGRKPTETSFYRVLLQKREYILRETHKY